MARVFWSTVMVGALSLSGVVSATDGPAVAAVPAVLAAPGPDIPIGPHDGPMVTSPDGSRAYVANGEAATLTVYELPTGTILSVIPLPGTASALTASRDGSAVYASTWSVANGNNFVTVSTVTNSVSSTLEMDNSAYTIAETADSTSLLVLGEGPTKPLYVVDAAAGTLTKTISTTGLDDTLESMAVWAGPTAAHAYITRVGLLSPSTSISEVLVVDLITEAIVRTIEPCEVIGAVAFTDDGSKAYFGCGDGQVAVVATSTGAVLERINVGFQVSYAQLTAGGTRLLVAGNLHRQVGEIDTATNEVVSTFTATGAVQDVEAPLLGNRVWYIRGNDDATSDLTSLTVGPASAVVPTEAPIVVPTTNAPTVPSTTKAATTSPSPRPTTTTTTTPSLGPVVAGDVALAATGAGMALPLVAGALLLIAAGAVAMRRRKSE